MNKHSQLVPPDRDSAIAEIAKVHAVLLVDEWTFGMSIGHGV
jgi:hypothetical protein